MFFIVLEIAPPNVPTCTSFIGNIIFLSKIFITACSVLLLSGAMNNTTVNHNFIAYFPKEVKTLETSHSFAILLLKSQCNRIFI